MNKELEQHIQQMTKEANTFHPDSPAHEYHNRGYKKGFKDADAIGFTEWLRTDKTANTYFEYRGLKMDGKYVTTEELYIIYLKTKTI